MLPILTIELPDYHLASDCDFDACGKKVDELIERHFASESIVIRAIGLCEHPGKTIEDVIAKVIEYGTDKYDSTRMSLFDEEFKDYRYDFHGESYGFMGSRLISLTSDNGGSPMGNTFRDFFIHAPSDRGFPVRIDLLLIYRASELEQPNPGTNRLGNYLFGFKHPEAKSRALIGIIKIL